MAAMVHSGMSMAAQEAENEAGDDMRALRRHLHRNPDLSGQEEATAAYVAQELSALGLEPQFVCGGRGLIVDLPWENTTTSHCPPTVALRADLDALPVTEATGLSFTSAKPDVMHACGHDGHTAMLFGAAQLLMRMPALPAPVRLLFQPAEETSEGARDMIAAGALEGVGAIFGGHLDRAYPLGDVVVHGGCVNASNDTVVIELTGRGGHAARPHECVDAVVMAATCVLQLQTLVSRELPPAVPAVLTLGTLHAGTVSNVIAGSARIEGTLRTLDDGVRGMMQAAARRVVAGVAAAHNGTASVRFDRGIPPVVNHPVALPLAHAAAVAATGTAEHITPLRTPNMGGEDFGVYLEHVVGCYVRYGACPPSEAAVSAHSATWDFDERALPLGAAYLASVARIAAAVLAGEAAKGVTTQEATAFQTAAMHDALKHSGREHSTDSQHRQMML